MKKFFSLILCVIIIMIPLSCLVASADTYGTSADGINGNASNYTATDSFKNGDFSEGFRYWSGSLNKYASKEASIITENGNSYIHILRNTDETLNSTRGVTSVPFAINGLAVGDEVHLYFDYKVEHLNPAATGQAPVVAVIKSKNGTTFASSMEFKSASKTSVPYMKRAGVKSTVTKAPETGANNFYIMSYINYNVAAEVCIDNITVAIKRNSGDNITPDGYYELTDGSLITELELNPQFYGSEQEGTNKKMTDYTPLDSFKNGDFSEGLKYWGKANANGGYASENACIETDGDNKYLVIDRNTVTNAAKGVYSVPFKVSGIKAGDVLAIDVDYKVETYPENNTTPYFYCALSQLQTTKLTFKSDNNVRVSSSSTVVNNENTSTPDGWTNVAWRQIVKTAPEDGEAVFYVQLYLQYNVAAKLSIDNIKILIKHNSADNYTTYGFYEQTDGSLISDNIFKGFTVGSGATTEEEIASGANDDNYPGITYSWVGTEADGIYSTSGNLGTGFPARTDFMNGDFESGLKYWFESTSTGFASDKFSIKTEQNGNSYLDYKTTSNATVCLNQTSFRLPKAEAGQELYVMYKFRGNGLISTTGYVRNAKEGTYPITRINELTSVLYYPVSENDWGYGVSEGYITVPDASQLSSSNLGSEFAYYVMMSFPADVSIDDIMFVTKTTYTFLGNTTTYYSDLDGHRINIPTNENTLHTNPDDGFDWSAVYGENNEKTEMFTYGSNNKHTAKFEVLSSAVQGAVTAKANLNNSGSLVFENQILNGELSNIEFTLPTGYDELMGKKLLFEYSITADYADASFSVAMKSGVVSRYETFKSSGNGFISAALNLDEIAADSFSELSFYSSQNAECNIRNVAFGYDDIGGIEGLYAKADGSPYSKSLGDANADDAINVKDLVRMKKYLASNETALYYAAANVKADDSLDSTDLIVLRTALLMQ